MDMLSGLVPHSMSHFLSALIHQKAGRGAAAEGQIIRRHARKQTRAPSLASSLGLVLLLLWLLTQLFCSFLQDNIIKMWRVHRSNLRKIHSCHHCYVHIFLRILITRVNFYEHRLKGSLTLSV